MKCPNCGSSDLLGLYAAFWAVIDEHGDSVKGFEHLSSETEITSARMCVDCDHEFEFE